MARNGFGGKVAIVTGGASGIGAATCMRLAQDGARVVVSDINLAGADAVAAQIRDAGGDARAAMLDMGDAAAIAEVAAQAIRELGRVDILINNAVRTDPADTQVAEIGVETWQAQLAVNLVGPALLSRAVIPSMLARGGGALVHVCSSAGILAEDTRTCYAASKSALFALSRSIAVQYGKQGIRSNCFAPGLVLTPAALNTFRQDQIEQLRATRMTPDFGTPEQVAGAIVFLCSEDAAYVTGHTLVGDGGYTAAGSIVPLRRLSPG